MSSADIIALTGILGMLTLAWIAYTIGCHHGYSDALDDRFRRVAKEGEDEKKMSLLIRSEITAYKAREMERRIKSKGRS